VNKRISSKHPIQQGFHDETTQRPSTNDSAKKATAQATANLPRGPLPRWKIEG